jgi:serine/threonine-protein kinase
VASIGAEVSHYRILEALGKGGMGEVYLAKDTRLDRLVALKVLSTELSEDAAAVKRFLREARMAASLSHPNIVSIYEVGAETGVHFIAMEYIQGTTLRQQIRQGPLEIETAVGIARQILDALACAHEAGIVHRDIKPENIMQSKSGHVKVLDFGLAREDLLETPEANQATLTEITEPGHIVGTVKYMSPERLRGKSADARSDIFAFGIVFYEMLAGRRPFEGGTSAEYTQRVLSSPPDALARFNYAVSEPLERVVRKCLEKDPDWRYQSTRELAIDLRLLERDGETSGITQRLPTSVSAIAQPAIASPARSRRLPWIIGALAVALAALAAGAYTFLRPSNPVDSLAVMPFVNSSGDSNLDYAADGLCESLRRDLSGLSGLSVTAQSVVERYRGKESDPLAVARELHVSAVLLGRLRRRAGNLELEAELIDGSKGTQLWSRSYEWSQSGLLDLESLLAGDISDRINSGSASRAAKSRARTTDAEAYDLYLKGRHLLRLRGLDDVQQAAQLFQQASSRDSRFALAYAGLADAYTLLANFGTQPPRTILPLAKSAAHRALELDDTLADAHASFGYASAFSDFDWAGAERSFRRAIQLNPNYPEAHVGFAITVLVPLKRFEEALMEAQRASTLEPGQPTGVMEVATVLLWARRFAESLDRFRQLDPAFLPDGRNALMALCLVGSGKPSEAVKAIGPAGRTADQTVAFRDAVLAFSYALAGRRAEAEQIAARLDRQATEKYVSACDRAGIQVGLEKPDRAMELLNQCYEDRDLDIRLLPVDVRYDRIRSDPRFQALLKKIGLR